MSGDERTGDVGRRRVLKGALAVPVASAAVLAMSDRPAAAHARTADMFDIRTYGALPANGAANTQAFTAALADIATHGGGVLYVPPGLWAVNAGISLDTPGTTLLGAGMTASTIALSTAPGVGDHLVKCNADRLSIERLTLRGHEPTPNVLGHHGIRVSGGPNDPTPVGGSRQWVRIRDVIVKSVRAYGIGLQGGSYSNIEIDNVSIFDCGSDGIDFKNDDTLGPVPPPDGPIRADAHPEASGARNIVRNVVVREFGLSKTTQAGIDVRGRVTVQSVEVFVTITNNSGVRFREAGTAHGLGGDWSTLENYYVTTAGADDPDNQSDSFDRGVHNGAPGMHTAWGTGNVRFVAVP